MSIDYAKMAKKAGQAIEKDSATFDEGDNLVLMVPVDPVKVEVWRGKVSSKFGRSVVDYSQPLCQTEEYRQALGFDPPESDLVGEVARDHFTADEMQKSRPNEITLWCVCILGHRRKGKSSGPFEPIYTKPKWMTAKHGKADKPHIQMGLDRLMADGGEDGVRAMFDLDAAQLLVVNRVGKGQFDTSFTVSLATGDDPEFGNLAAFNVSDEIRNDIAEATAPGGSCDLIKIVADKFSPSPDEVAQRFSAAEAGPAKPGMDE